MITQPTEAYMGQFLRHQQERKYFVVRKQNARVVAHRANDQHGGADMDMLSQKRSGIYCYENLVNGKKYIGQSIDINRRVAEHERNFKNPKQGNENREMLNDILKYGRKSFKFFIVCYCHVDRLNELEVFYIQSMKSHVTKGGYNVLIGGNDIPNSRGVKLSEAVVENIRKAKLGLLNPFFGKKHSSKSREKMSINRTGEKNHLFGKKAKDGTSRYFGVHFIRIKSHGRFTDYWESAVSGGKRKIYIGRFQNEVDAAKAYDRYVIENGLKNPLNFGVKNP